MTNDTFIKANDIRKKIENFINLRYIANKSYKKFMLAKKFLWISDYDEHEVILCDKELSKMIAEYCDKKIKELQEELNKL